MPRPSPLADAAAVFQEAKQLVAEARRSRQRSPIRGFLEHVEGSDVLLDISPKRDNNISEPKLDLQTLLSRGVHSLATASIWDQGAASSHAIACQHDNPAPQPFQMAPRSYIPSYYISLQSNTSPKTSPPQLQSLATHDISAPQHRGDWIAPSGAADLDTDTSGGDQPSRWQILVRRVNAEVVATASGLSPTKLVPSPGGQYPPGGSNTASPMGQCSAAGAQYRSADKVCTNSAAVATTTVEPYATSRGERERVTTIRCSAPMACSSDNGIAGVHADARSSVTKGLPAAPAGAADGSSATASIGGAGRRQRAGQSNAPATLASPYERAVAALQQAEQQLRDHQQGHGGSGCGDGSAVASPASAKLAAAERFLTTGLPLRQTVVPRNMSKYGNARAATPLGTAADVDIAAEGSFEEVAWGIVHRLASSVRLGLRMPSAAASGSLMHSYTVMEPPPAQHVVAAAALAAAAATSGVARAASTAATPELELQIEMQSLMAAAREASTEEALKAKQRLLQREAEATAAAAITAVEDRAVQLARVVLYIRLWGLAAKWSRRETEEHRARLHASRTRCCFAAWRSTARAVRAARLAAEAVELVEATRREEVACRFRRLWLLHYSLAAWRRAAVASAEERRCQVVRVAELSCEQQAEALRDATADRFRRLWLLHSHMRTWRAAARAQATARLVAGAGRGGIVAASGARSCGGPAQDQQRRRTTAVAALLDRLRCQREAFRSTAGTPHPSAVVMTSGSQHSGETKEAKVNDVSTGHASGGRSGPLPPSVPGLSHTSAAAATPATASAKTSRPFPGLNKWIRPEVMRGRRDATANASSGPAAANPTAAVAPPPLAGGTRATVPVPFQLSTSARARYRRNQVLAACDDTRHMVATAVMGTRVTTDPWVASTAVPTGTAAVWAAGNCTGRSDSPPGFNRSSAGGRGLSQGSADNRSQNSDAALNVLRQMVRRRHQQCVSDASGVDSGVVGAAQVAAGSCDLGASKEELVAADDTGLWGDVAADGQMRQGPLNLSSVSSVWSSGGETSAAVEGEEEAEKHNCRMEEGQRKDIRKSTGGADSDQKLGPEIHGARHEVDFRAGSGSCAEGLAVTAATYGTDPFRDREEGFPPAYFPSKETRVMMLPPPPPPTVKPQSMVHNSCEPQHDEQHGWLQQSHQKQLEQSQPSDRITCIPTASSSTLRQTRAVLQSLPLKCGIPRTMDTSSNPTSTGSRPGVFNSTTSPTPHNNIRPAAAAGCNATFTPVDLERLRAAEVRRRRQADEQARRLALELAAHMEQLAGVHHVRGLLKWHGLMPWMQLVATARQKAQRADRHFITGMLQRALLGLSQGAVRARVRTVSRMAAAVAVGRSRKRDRLARVILDRLLAWTRAAVFHRQHRYRGVLLGLMRVARAGWASRADAAEHWHRRRLWGCFHGWRAAAEKQASEQLLWELEREREVEIVLGRRTARRVLAEWRRLGQEAVEQRAVLQHRSQQWAKVQGWLAEVQIAREQTRRSTKGGSVITAVANRKLCGGHGHDHNGGGARGDASYSDPLRQSLMATGSSDTGAIAAEDQTADGGRTARASQCSSGRSDAVGILRVTADTDGDDDPLGLGPLEEQLQQFSLGSSCLVPQAAGSRRGAALDSGTDPWVGESGGRRIAWIAGPAGSTTMAPVVSESDYGPKKWAERREQGPMRRPVGPPLLASRQERLARYLERTPGGA
ncbi:hypothetical protein VaNZ11_003660 [Volvox africanus]|uniref:Sfi1 spindle body domain-containing protein n=1 Tax=Volvox africanus TaxID=51714 RepID=A0ABQ5RUK5_9CHLO|nr:hypothetical protein VaNZ11_003660 [Volvox africanus]